MVVEIGLVLIAVFAVGYYLGANAGWNYHRQRTLEAIDWLESKQKDALKP